jgi:hypothetical protein
MGGVDYQVNELIFCGGWPPRNKEVCHISDFRNFRTTMGEYGLCLNHLLSMKPHQHPSKGGI